MKKTKILLISTSDIGGGAAIACMRAAKALQNNPVLEVKLLVQEKKSDLAWVVPVAQTYWQKKMAFFRFVWERLRFWQYAKDKSVRFAFSPANTGIDISQHPLVQEADLLHLHWVHFGFLSLKSIEQLTQLGKPIVWTLQDMWSFTGGCHYVGYCKGYQKTCGNCPMLKNPSLQDLSHQVWKKKEDIYKNFPFIITPTSQWLAGEATQSSLFRTKHIEAIPAPIDTTLFCPSLDKKSHRQALNLSADSFVILFGAANISDERKGFKYLRTALAQFADTLSPTQRQKINLLVFGKFKTETLSDLPFTVINFGKMNLTALVQVYQSANAFVMPSLEDNLPNTVLEALACATPVVAFLTGGIPEMVMHQENGYLADYQSADDLTQGIAWLYEIHQNDTVTYEALCQTARKTILENFSEEVINERYTGFYQALLEQQ